MSLTFIKLAHKTTAAAVFSSRRTWMQSLRCLTTGTTSWEGARPVAGYNGATALYRHEPTGQISFLDAAPIVPGSPTILGTLSAEHARFQENPAFVQLLHAVLASVYLQDPHVRDLALSRKSADVDSYLHVLGTRAKDQFINDRDPACIIFSFLAHCTTGLPIPNTYEPNPALRLYTPLDGFLVLPPSLHHALLRGCQVARSIELQESPHSSK
ncbi:hypothetical protein VP01_1629g1 [Puccinia sorghi]|uniref:Uncharacterized protein n=1 Tax=Puccinia sorghi TaxID=27349 RepID=A0A0L6VIR0_9BASI|nr:hypothetical protein VP01_1629g1 [Puccinia sorghi]